MLHDETSTSILQDVPNITFFNVSDIVPRMIVGYLGR